MKNFNGNLKNMILCFGVGSALTFAGTQIAQNISFSSNSVNDSGAVSVSVESNDAHFAHQNHLSNDEFLEEFQRIFRHSDLLQTEFSDVYPYLCDFVATYGEYLDQDAILRNLPTLSIEYLDMYTADDSINATYYLDKNSIEFNERIRYKRLGQTNEVKLHEFIHFLLHNGFKTAEGNEKNLGFGLDEGIASLITREYGVYDSLDSYEKNTYYVYVISELVGEDNFIKAVCAHDWNYLISCLEQYISREEALQLISAIDDACLYYNSQCAADEKAWKIINDIYVNKHDELIKYSDDIIMKACSNKLIKTDYEIPGARYNFHVVVDKPIFVNKGENHVLLCQMDRFYYGDLLLDENNHLVSGTVLEDGFYAEDGVTPVDSDGNIIDAGTISLGGNQKTL